MGNSRRQTVIICVIFVSITLLTFNNCTPQKNSTNSSLGSLSDCKPRNGATGAPKTIEQVVDLINSLPKPTTLPCFLESLQRPISMFATYSESSVQPARGQRSPRIFIFQDDLILAIAPEGPGANLLEMSLIKGSGRSVKAEIDFPVSVSISHSLPYERIRSGTGTSCGTCHTGEARDSSIAGGYAFVSEAIRPSFFTYVSVESIKTENDTCDVSKEPSRCRFLRSLFDHGPVIDTDFPSSIPGF